MFETTHDDGTTFFSNDDIDKLSSSGNYMSHIFDDIYRDHQPKMILDVGCGDGFFGSYFISKYQCRVDGADASHYGLGLAKSKGYGEVIVVNDLNKATLLPLATYDLALCKDVLEHLYQPRSLIKSIGETLKQNGLALFLVPNHFLLYHRLKFLFTNNIDTQNYFPNSDSFNFPHIRFFKDADMRANFRQEGFSVTKTYHGHFAHFPLIGRLPFAKRIKKSLAESYPDQFATALAYLCRKD